MSGVLDFLFEGRPPASINTYGTTVENIPKWMSDYTQGLIGRANAIAAEGYTPYGGPRIAGFTPDQMQAFDMVRGNVGSWQPGMQYAAGLTQAAGGTNPLNVAAPFLAKSAAEFPTEAGRYMDPYIGHVLNRQEELSNRNLRENIIPAMQDAFVGAGSFGGDRMVDISSRIARDTAEGLQGQQLGALSDAYRNAGVLFGQDAQRQLQTGMTAGNLAGDTGDIQLRAADSMGALNEALQQMQFRDATGMEAIGRQGQQQTQQSLDLAYQDFLRQQNYPREMIDWMSSTIRGIPHATATQTTETGPANIYGPAPLAQIGSLYSTWKGLENPNG